jgi:hypothetical protein
VQIKGLWYIFERLCVRAEKWSAMPSDQWLRALLTVAFFAALFIAIIYLGRLIVIP